MSTEKDEIINKDLFKKYFHEFESLSDMQKNCLKHRIHKKHKEIVQIIQNGMTNFEKEISNMPKDKELYEILDTVLNIVEFNKQDQQGQGLKSLTSQ